MAKAKSLLIAGMLSVTAYASDSLAAPACTIGTPGFGMCVLVNGNCIPPEIYDFEDAIKSLKSLQDTGVCPQNIQVPCAIGSSGFGTEVIVNGTIVPPAFDSIEEAASTLKKLQTAGICEKPAN